MDEHAKCKHCSIGKCFIPTEVLTHIARKICIDWRNILRCLDQRDHAIEKIEEDAKFQRWDAEERSYQGLLKWMRCNGKSASMCRLKHGLRKAERNDLADSLSKELHHDDALRDIFVARYQEQERFLNSQLIEQAMELEKIKKENSRIADEKDGKDKVKPHTEGEPLQTCVNCSKLQDSYSVLNIKYKMMEERNKKRHSQLSEEVDDLVDKVATMENKILRCTREHMEYTSPGQITRVLSTAQCNNTVVSVTETHNKTKIKDLEAAVESLKEHIKENEAEIKNLKTKINSFEAEIREREDEIKKLEAALTNQMVSDAGSQSKTKIKLNICEADVKYLKTQLKNSEARIRILETDFVNVNRIVHDSVKPIVDVATNIKKLCSENQP